MSHLPCLPPAHSEIGFHLFHPPSVPGLRSFSPAALRARQHFHMGGVEVGRIILGLIGKGLYRDIVPPSPLGCGPGYPATPSQRVCVCLRPPSVGRSPERTKNTSSLAGGMSLSRYFVLGSSSHPPLKCAVELSDDQRAPILLSLLTFPAAVTALTWCLALQRSSG